MELVSLIRKENLGEPHGVLSGGERYFSDRLAQQDGVRADDELRDMVALVQRARVEHYAWISAEGGASVALVAASGRAAVLITRVGDYVTLAGVDPDRLVGALVRQLPEVPAGRGESITIRTADYPPPDAGTEGFLQRPPKERSPEARRLDLLLEAPRLGGATLYTARRDNGGPGAGHRTGSPCSTLPSTGAGSSTPGRGAASGRSTRCPARPRCLPPSSPSCTRR